MVSLSKLFLMIMGSTTNLTFMYFNEYRASMGLDGELLAGNIPVKQLRMVQDWMAIHEDELYSAWNDAVRGIPFGKVEPLQ